ncbi:GPP34 family phosphoprotein [Egibacter rhizosphaerae]|uniref:GPP34 family phosphoprotein n=1 Tax=Egibacter rhizosphaerae TaxID=1670831 RepID=A0A411YIP0_9ACTN|nr:GPP34 family phosphoprotein [Egibacter rhizosphaerae]QBI21100.1 GPP34 family phosphoprotein [Egibacter rhizosphaerae]
MVDDSPTDGTRLSLPEELLLLGWDDERGKNTGTANLLALLGGAAFLDLALRGAIDATGKHVEAREGDTGHPVLDGVLERIRTDRKSRDVKGWVGWYGQRNDLRDEVLDHLLAQGIVRREERKILGLIRLTRHPVTQRVRVEELRRRAGALLTSSEPLDDPRDAALGGLLEPAGGTLRARLVPRGQRRAAARRAKELAKGEGMSSEVADAIGEANAAAMAAITAAAAVSAASAGSSGGSN